MSRFTLLTLTACLACATVLQAGVQFPVKPGETVVAGQYLVRLQPGVASSLISTYFPGATIVPLHGLNLHLVTVPKAQASIAAVIQAAVTSIAADVLVQYIEPNHVRHFALATPNDLAYINSNQWDLNTVQAFQAWNLLANPYLTSASANPGRITAASIDTGGDCTHPDFANSGGTSSDSLWGGQILWGGSHAFYPTAVPSPACAWQDDYGHGTHVAGTVAAATNNGVGVAALAYPLQLVVYKGLASDGSGTDSVLANAIMTAADAGVRVISASWGDTGYSQALQDAITYAWQRNTLFVAAAGNNGNSALFFPAGATFAVGVAATDVNNNRASFSNNGDYVRIAAPGVNIYSTMPTYASALGQINYGNLSGTSMATPHVAALAGLLFTQTPNASAAAVLQRIQQSASADSENTANGGWTGDFGFGIINAYNALNGTLRTASVGALTGQVTDQQGNLIAAQLMVNGSPTSADSSGRYRIANLPANPYTTYTVKVTAPGYSPVTLSATIAAGADTILPLTLGTNYGGFTGVVTSGGSPVAGAIVQALSGGLINATAVADGNGIYNLWVAPGTYDVMASALSANPGVVSAQSVTGGNVTTVNLSITRPSNASPVTVMTNIPGLNIVVDGTTYTSPHFFTWTQGSTHTIDTTATQGTSPTQYVFTGWSNGGNKSQTVTGNGATFYTANFKTQYLLTTTAAPPTGGSITPSAGFYDAGTQLTVTATASSGNVFTGFTGDLSGITNPQSLTMSAPRSVTASFGQPIITVTTAPAGLSIVVDGTTYTAPQSFTWTQGSTHTLDTTATQGSGTTQYAFTGWNNAGTKSQSITVNGSATFTASFKTRYQLTTAANPSGQGSISPPTGFYDSGTPVTITATASSGFQLLGFSGDLSGTTNPQSLTMSAAHSVTANFTAVTTNDLALGKTATQSSTLGGFGPTTVASSAVDGNTDGNFFNGSVSHTNADANPWWQVDLGATSSIGSVAIWNRTDCCGDRLSDYWVFVSNTPFLSTDTPTSLQSRAGTWSSHQTTFPNPSTSIAVNTQGRYVRVQLSSSNYLNLAEVQVFGSGSGPITYGISGQVTLSGAALNGVTMTLSGSQSGSIATSGAGNYSFTGLAGAGNYTITPSLSGYTFTPPSLTFNSLAANQTANFTATAVTGTTNLALGKVATQSGTLNGYGPSTAASSAVDGNTDGNFSHGSVSHTDIVGLPWWQVDLGAPATIGSIVVWNRTDCCSDRLSDYWVFVSNTPFLASDTPSTLQGRAGTWSSHQTTFPNPSSTIPVNAQGQYVRVQLSNTNYLSLAEVQVFGSGSGGPTTFGISGQVTLSNAGLNGVTVALSGSQSASTVTSGSGNYSFTGLASGGTYTVTPSLTGYTFSPPGTTFTSLAANQTSNFIATATTGASNLAIGKTAVQSSTLAGFGSWTAAASAVDGKTDGNFFDGSVSHTDIIGNSWWQVDLGASATINSIAIWNRTDCCSDRLSDYWIFVSNTPFLATDTPGTLQGRAGTWSSHQTTFPNPSSTIPVNAPGRYVRVQLSNTNYLSLAEVQVFGQ